MRICSSLASGVSSESGSSSAVGRFCNELYCIMTEEAGGKGARISWERAIPPCRGAERNMGIEQRPSLDAQTWAESELLLLSPPCLRQ